MNTVKDLYFWAVSFIETHPNVAFWAFVVVLALNLVR